MSDVVLVSLITSLIGSASTVGAILITGWARRNEAHETWARTDKVAADARAEAIAQRESQALIADEAHRTSVRLDVVHDLVNNALTVEKTRALLQTRGQLSRARVEMALLIELGRPDDAVRVKEDITMLKSDIIDIQTELADRDRQLKLAGPAIAETEAHPM